MRTSEEYKNIYSAIIKMRTEIAPVAKTKIARTPRYSYAYATLDSIIELLTVVLPKHGLGWIQSIGTEDGRQVLTTRIIHESGEWLEDTFALPEIGTDGGKTANQELGASITYFKRYALSALFGVATDEDTDGVAEVRERKQQVRANARAAAQPQPANDDKTDPAEIAPADGGPLPLDAQVIYSPTPAQPVPAITEGNVCSFSSIIQSTGDAMIDGAIAALVTREYRGRPLFNQKAVARLNEIIRGQTPQEALASANMAAGKLIAAADKKEKTA